MELKTGTDQYGTNPFPSSCPEDVNSDNTVNAAGISDHYVFDRLLFFAKLLFLGKNDIISYKNKMKEHLLNTHQESWFWKKHYCEATKEMARKHPDPKARSFYEVISGNSDLLSLLNRQSASHPATTLEHAVMRILPVIQYADIYKASKKGELVVPPFEKYTQADWQEAIESFLKDDSLHQALDWRIATQVPERYVIFQVLLAQHFKDHHGKLTICDLGSGSPPVSLAILNTAKMRDIFSKNVNCPSWSYQPIGAKEIERIAVDIQAGIGFHPLAWIMSCIWPGCKVYREQLLEAYDPELLKAVDFRHSEAVEALKEMSDRSCDVVISSLMAYQQYRYIAEYLWEISRVLKSNGLYIETRMYWNLGECMTTVGIRTDKPAHYIKQAHLFHDYHIASTDENVRGEITSYPGILPPEMRPSVLPGGGLLYYSQL